MQRRITRAKRKAANLCTECAAPATSRKCEACQIKAKAENKRYSLKNSWHKGAETFTEMCKRCEKPFTYDIIGGRRRRQYCNRCVKWSRPRKAHIEHKAPCRECQQVFKFHYFPGGTPASYCSKTCQRAATHRKREWGISPEQFREMLAEQANSCKCCGDDLGTAHDRHIDHCHTTEVIRGILCHYCNTGIGMFKDDPERLAKAIEYLSGRTALVFP